MDAGTDPNNPFRHRIHGRAYTWHWNGVACIACAGKSKLLIELLNGLRSQRRDELEVR